MLAGPQTVCYKTMNVGKLFALEYFQDEPFLLATGTYLLNLFNCLFIWCSVSFELPPSLVSYIVLIALIECTIANKMYDPYRGR